MSHHAALLADLRSARKFFEISTACLTEEDSGFAPVPGTWTVAQQVAHAAQTVDWFREGAFRPEGFDTDFEKLGAEVQEFRSLAAARAWLARAFDQILEVVQAASPESLAEPLPPGIMGGAPRAAVVSALVDHTAHHRGVLTVYSRLLGKVPAMPYMEEPAPVPVEA
jgi:uncharacterized damage-inducible protein DinB